MGMITLYLHEALTLNTEPLLESYEIFDEDKRKDLNEKIFDAYMNREIGAETISQFVFNMNRKMRQIMPYYNQLYKTEQLKFDPFATIDIHTFTETAAKADSADTVNATGSETSTTDSTSTSKGETVAYSFPQERLAGNKDYASNAQDNNSDSTATAEAQGSNTSTQDGTSTSTQDGTSESTSTGFQGDRSLLLMNYRSTILNIDMDIIRELEPCFMQVLSIGDSFVQERHFF